MSKYSVAFTAGALLHQEFVLIVPLLLHEDKEAIKEEIRTGTLTGINAESSRKRKVSEIQKRYKAVDKSVWELFVNVDEQKQRVLLYYVCLKTYQLLQDFHIDVLLEKWKRYDLEVSKNDYSSFLFKKSDDNPEIIEWTDQTINKVISTARLMLKETGITVNDKLQQIDQPDKFWSFFIQLNEFWFLELMFMTVDEIKSIIEK